MIPITGIFTDCAIAIQGDRDGRREICIVAKPEKIVAVDGDGDTRAVRLILTAAQAKQLADAMRVEALDTKLMAWLRRKQMTSADLGEQLGVSRSTMQRIAAGLASPKLKIAIAIQAFTNDEVMPADLVYDDEDDDAPAARKPEAPLAVADGVEFDPIRQPDRRADPWDARAEALPDNESVA